MARPIISRHGFAMNRDMGIEEALSRYGLPLSPCGSKAPSESADAEDTRSSPNSGPSGPSEVGNGYQLLKMLHTDGGGEDQLLNMIDTLLTDDAEETRSLPNSGPSQPSEAGNKAELLTGSRDDGGRAGESSAPEPLPEPAVQQHIGVGTFVGGTFVMVGGDAVPSQADQKQRRTRNKIVVPPATPKWWLSAGQWLGAGQSTPPSRSSTADSSAPGREGGAAWLASTWTCTCSRGGFTGRFCDKGNQCKKIGDAAHCRQFCHAHPSTQRPRTRARA